MKILLVQPTIDTAYEVIYPLGLMNLYLIGKKLGCDMELLDLSRASYAQGLDKILSKEYDLIGISCNFTNAAPACMRYAADIKNKYPRTMVISGGNHATLAPQDLLFNSYDYVAYGEGEATFEEFLKRRLSGKEARDLKGVIYLEDGKIVKNPPREPIADLDILPFNDFSEFDLRPYFKASKVRYVNIETCRGCIFNCSFCATVRMWGHKFRNKSSERVAEELRVAKKLGADFVFFNDDDTGIGQEHLRGICKTLIKQNLDIAWGTTIGSSAIKDKSIYDLMAQSGCVKVNICIESANPRILKEYRKPYSIEDNRATCMELLKRGILVHNHGIIGFVDETLRETLNTYFYLIKTSPIWHISILEPRPGNDYWKDWGGKGNASQYKLFGKANVILSRRKVSNYIVYRLFALFYFLNPVRIKNAFFIKNKAIRYNYAIQYRVAYKTLRENLLNLFVKK